MTYIIDKLEPAVESAEARSIARILIELFRDTPDLTPGDLDKSIYRILQGEPVQYVSGHTWFYHLKLLVNRHVLVPRPETEELVDWVIHDAKSLPHEKSISILDIGTGSGCIAVALAKHIRGAHVEAIDLSEAALDVAKLNAETNRVSIIFRQMDFLSDAMEGRYDIITCNPPYISRQELDLLEKNVLEFEPHLALTASGDDPLIFYRRLTSVVYANLHSGGALYVELSEFRAHEIHGLFIECGYRTEMRRDMQGKWRMLCVRK